MDVGGGVVGGLVGKCVGPPVVGFPVGLRVVGFPVGALVVGRGVGAFVVGFFDGDLVGRDSKFLRTLVAAVGGVNDGTAQTESEAEYG